MKIVLNTDMIPDGVRLVAKIAFLIVCGALIGIAAVAAMAVCFDVPPAYQWMLSVGCGWLGGQIMLLWALD